MADEVIADACVDADVRDERPDEYLIPVAVGYIRKLAAEIQRHRAAAKARAAVPMPISRERLEWLALNEFTRQERIENDGLVPEGLDGTRLSCTSFVEEQALARFALAHMDAEQQPLGSEAPKETEPSATWLGDCEPIREKALEDLRRARALLCRCEPAKRQKLLDDIAALRAEVERRVDTVRRAALALIESRTP